jgi:hypothetical protein
MSNTESAKTETKKTETKAAPAGAAQTPANPFAAFCLRSDGVLNASQQMFRDAMAQAQAQTSAMTDKFPPSTRWAAGRASARR